MAFLNGEIINICPNDTRGEIVYIDGLSIQLPEVPEHKDIMFHDKPVEEQMWDRVELPPALAAIDSEDEWDEQPKEFKQRYEPYVEREFHRRKYGVWFYNNGTPTYLTGKHYMFLQWSKFDFGYPFFIQPQWKLFIHWEACRVDPRCFGQVHVKNRRAGWSSIATAELVDESTQTYESWFGMLSKTNDDARDVLFKDKVVNIYRNYPFFFKPISDSNSDPKSELTFREPASRKKKKTVKESGALNTRIDFKATKTNSYDGAKLKRLIHDEAGKWLTPNDIWKNWQVTKKCLIDRTRIIGKCMMGSTVNPMNQGGSGFKKIYYMSNPTERDPISGRTGSGLYSIFIPAYETVILDKYGRSIVEDPEKPFISIDGESLNYGGKTFLLAQRESLKGNSDDYAEEKRQMPFDIDEAFMDFNESSIFDIVKLNEQMFYNNELEVRPYTQGRFHWIDGHRFGDVMFIPETNGPWQISHFLEPEDRNKYYERGAHKYPANDWLGVAGVDPYKVDATVDGRGSRASMHIVTRANMKYPSNMCIARYNSREQTALLAYEQMLMASIFFGVPMLIENNVRRMIDKLVEEWGYMGYVLKRPKALTPKSSRGVAQYGIPMNSEDIAQAHAHAVQAYVNNHIGINSDTGEMGEFFFNETLRDLIIYDIKNRTKHDDTISLGLALLGLQVQPREEKKVTVSKPFVRRYDNSGTISKRSR